VVLFLRKTIIRGDFVSIVAEKEQQYRQNQDGAIILTPRADTLG
tara:strand:+ start:85 stop:216 length:132 start_codon:yes stop_codon:yes gene_type:complete